MSQRRLKRRPLLLVALAAAVALLAVPALARVGGGESYGGGGSSSGSGGGDGGGEFILELLYWMLRLTFEVPVIGVPLDVIVIGGVVYFYWTNKKGDASERSSAAADAISRAARAQGAIASRMERLRETDTYFSIHPFLDFVQLLYVRTQQSRGHSDLAALSPFLAPELLRGLQPAETPPAGPRLDRVENVIVGVTRLFDVQPNVNDEACIVVQIEANFTEVSKGPDGAEQRRDLYSNERWSFYKAASVASKAPETIAALSCPNCGASGELSLDARCAHCGQVVNNGRFHWVVRQIEVLERRDKQPIEVTRGGGVEAGTDLPTVFDFDLQSERRAFELSNPGFDWGAFDEHVRRTFTALQAAWTEMDWGRARPLETDHLFETHRYWIERYRSSGLNNRLVEPVIERTVLARVRRDAYYEALTMRIWASAYDYTVDQQNNVVAGSRTRKRQFSEYWTFIQRIPGQRKPLADPRDPTAAASCPSCGAPLKITQGAICEYCGAKVTSGEFGWVLSLIEQDEAYGG